MRDSLDEALLRQMEKSILLDTVYDERRISEEAMQALLRERCVEALCAIRRALDADKPVFGICRGIQLLNICLGGTLYQDLPTEHGSAVDHHMTPPYDRAVHEVTILADTPLAALLGKMRLGVNSYHHQAVKALAPVLRPMALADDGLIEAAYLPGKRFCMAVQWHPEFSYKTDADSRALLAAFVRAAAK